MCGIAGYFSVDGADQTRLKTVAALLAVGIESRGGQSWGTLSGDSINKGVGPISEGLHLPDVMPPNYVMHTRFATHGRITVENAHPFTQGEVSGVHNGVISNHAELNATYGREFAVDSQHIFQHFAEGRYALADLRGYGAFVYRNEGHWYGGTFNRGDLEVANTSLGKIFASTQYAVRKACILAGIEIESWDVLKDNAIYQFKPEGAFKQFDIVAHGTAAKWDDSQTMDDWFTRRHGKKNESDPGTALVLASSINGIEIEEHNESSTGIACAHCHGDCLPEKHYKNDSGETVCIDCAKGSYSYIAPDEYCVSHTGGKYELLCELCGDERINPIITLVTEGMVICQDCFDKQFNTTGLRKVTSASVN